MVNGNGAASRPVMVGVDGSEASLNAVRWAARDAALRKRPLLVVAVIPLPHIVDVPAGATWQEKTYDAAEDAALRAVARAAETARETAPGVTVSTYVTPGPPAGRLVEVAQHAGLVVMGRRGSGGFDSQLLGSTALTVARHTDRTTIVVPDEATPHPHGRVVVGADGSERTETALSFGFEEAALRGSALTAVQVWQHPFAGVPGLSVPLPAPPDEFWTEHRQRLADTLAGWADKYPGVDTDPAVFYGSCALCLLTSATDAELLVVTPRSGSSFPALRLGSVTESVVRHATCPVAIARQGNGE